MTPTDLWNLLRAYDPKRYEGKHVKVHRKVGDSMRYGRYASLEATEAFDIAVVLEVPLDKLFKGCK